MTTTSAIKKQAGDTWIDDKGIEIPKNRISKSEKHAEAQSIKIARQALKAYNDLKTLAEMCEDGIESNNKVYHEERHMDVPDVGSYTLYSFNKDIKIQRVIQGRDGYDERVLKKAYSDLIEYLDSTQDKSMVNTLLHELIKSRSGKLDMVKADRIVEIVEQAKLKSDDPLHGIAETLKSDKKKKEAKVYHKVFIKNKKGEYRTVPLSLYLV